MSYIKQLLHRLSSLFSNYGGSVMREMVCYRSFRNDCVRETQKTEVNPMNKKPKQTIQSMIWLVLLLMVSHGLVQAQVVPNTQNIIQNGLNNNLGYEQTHYGNSFTVIQVSNDQVNNALIKQLSPYNAILMEQYHSVLAGPQDAHVEQVGEGGNEVNLIQGDDVAPMYLGYGNSAWIKQDGGGNFVDQRQIYTNQTSTILQEGSYNTAELLQESPLGSTSDVEQYGENNQLTQSQKGLTLIHAAVHDQVGNPVSDAPVAGESMVDVAHTMDVRQVGKEQTAVQDQSGLEQIGFVLQGNEIGTGYRPTNSNFALSNIGQKITLDQEGDKNMVEQIQSGLNNFTIALHVDRLSTGLNVPVGGLAVSNLGHSAAVVQTGDEQSVTQTQTGLDEFNVSFVDEGGYFSGSQIPAGGISLSDFGHKASATQDGELNTATQSQKGLDHLNIVFENDKSNSGTSSTGTIRLSSFGHQASVTQKGMQNYADQKQEGLSNVSVVFEGGSGYTALPNQLDLPLMEGFGHDAQIEQEGDDNWATQKQIGDDDLILVFDGVTAIIEKFGHRALIMQYGDGNEAIQSQRGLNHLAEIHQNGTINYAEEVQIGENHMAKIYQNGY
jgi:hypothetical protein